MIQSRKQVDFAPLKQIFGDINYAWELLQSEINLQLNLSNSMTGQDISKILQLYMRGVQRMNSLMDIRQSFFKNKVTALMTKPGVIKILNKPMAKKNNKAILVAEPVLPTQQRKIMDPLTQIHLQEKRKQMEMRVAYGAQQHNPDNLKKLLVEQSNKQTILTTKINKIVGDHEQRLMNRIKQRKLRTMTAKSRSVAPGVDTKKQMEQSRDEEQFGKFSGKQQQKHNGEDKKKQRQWKRKCRSVSPPKIEWDQEIDIPTKRRVSMDFRYYKMSQ